MWMEASKSRSLQKGAINIRYKREEHNQKDSERTQSL